MAAATPGMVVRRGMLFFYGERSRAASLEYYPPSRKGALIPDYETLMLPLLQLLEGGETRSIAECRSKLAGHFDLTSEELTQFIPSGRTLLFSGRVHWAKTYLGKAGAVESPARGQVRITDRGRELLALRLDRVTTALLTERYEEMREWRRASRAPNQTGPVATDVEGVGGLSPDEALEASYRRIREATESDLLERARATSPEQFEQLVVDLLLALDYGGPSGSGIRLGRSGDGGVDGVIQQDKLGFERIYVQAKRWQASVGPSVVREFASSLRLRGATKGVIITTSTFTDVAVTEAERLGVVLVHGGTLAELMFDVGLGVSVVSTYSVKRVDAGYFETEE